MMKYKLLSVALLYFFGTSPTKAQDVLKIPGIPRDFSWANKPISYKIGPGSVFIVAGEKTDMFRDPNVTYNTDNAPRLSFYTDSNFVLTAGILPFQ